MARRMPATSRQLLTVSRLSGISEDNLRDVICLSNIQAHAILDAAATGNPASTMDALINAGIVPSDNAGFESAVTAYAKHKNGKSAATPAATPEVKAAGEVPAEAAVIRAAIARSVSILNDTMQSDILGQVDQLATMLAEVAAHKSVPELPAVPAGGSPSYIRPRWFNELYSLVDAGFDVLIHGPAGCGKSRAGIEVGRLLQREGSTFAFRAGMRKADILYSKELRDGQSVTELAPLLKEVQQPVVSVIDEVFSVDPEILIGLNGLLESGQRAIDTPLGLIKRDDLHRFILTANTDGRSESRLYRAPQAQDASTLSRVISVHVDYDDDVELQIAASSLAPDWQWLAEQAHNLRRSVRENAISMDVSTRWIMQACQLNARGFTKERAFGLTMLERLSESERKRVGSAVCQLPACFAPAAA